jgi:hypothetical protein
MSTQGKGTIMQISFTLTSAQKIAAELAHHDFEIRLFRKILRAIKQRDSDEAIAKKLHESRRDHHTREVSRGR